MRDLLLCRRAFVYCVTLSLHFASLRREVRAFETVYGRGVMLHRRCSSYSIIGLSVVGRVLWHEENTLGLSSPVYFDCFVLALAPSFREINAVGGLIECGFSEKTGEDRPLSDVIVWMTFRTIRNT